MARPPAVSCLGSQSHTFRIPLFLGDLTSKHSRCCGWGAIDACNIRPDSRKRRERRTVGSEVVDALSSRGNVEDAMMSMLRRFGGCPPLLHLSPAVSSKGCYSFDSSSFLPTPSLYRVLFIFAPESSTLILLLIALPTFLHNSSPGRLSIHSRRHADLHAHHDRLPLRGIRFRRSQSRRRAIRSVEHSSRARAQRQLLHLLHRLRPGSVDERHPRMYWKLGVRLERISPRLIRKSMPPRRQHF